MLFYHSPLIFVSYWAGLGPGNKACIKKLPSGGTDTGCNLKSKQILVNHNENYWNANDFIVGEVLCDVTMCHQVIG